MSGEKAIKSGIWYTISTFIVKGVVFLTTPVFTRILTQGEYGEFLNFQTWMMILLYITSLNLEGSLIRVVYDFKNDTNRYIYSMFLLSGLSTLVSFVLVCLFINPVSKLTSVEPRYIYIMFGYLLFAPVVSLFQGMERYKYNYMWTVATSLTVSIGSSVLAVLLVLFSNNKLMGIVIGHVVPTVVVGLVILIYYFIKVKTPDLKYWKYALPIVIPYIPHLLSMYLLSNMDRVMIKRMLGEDKLAVYGLAYTCGMLIVILVMSINSAFSPWLAEQLQAKNYAKTRQVSVIYVLVGAVCALGVVLISPEILLIMGGSSYFEARFVLPPVTAGCLVQFVYCMYVNIEQFQKKTIGMAIGSVIAALVNFGLNYYFIPRYGYIAAAYTTFVSYSVLLVIHMIVVGRLKMLKVYDNVRLIGVTVISVLLILLTTLIIDAIVVRYVLVAIMASIALVMIYRYRTQIINLRKK